MIYDNIPKKPLKINININRLLEELMAKPYQINVFSVRNNTRIIAIDVYNDYGDVVCCALCNMLDKEMYLCEYTIGYDRNMNVVDGIGECPYHKICTINCC